MNHFIKQRSGTKVSQWKSHCVNFTWRPSPVQHTTRRTREKKLDGQAVLTGDVALSRSLKVLCSYWLVNETLPSSRCPEKGPNSSYGKTAPTNDATTTTTLHWRQGMVLFWLWAVFHLRQTSLLEIWPQGLTFILLGRNTYSNRD